ncbi:MAG: type II toxin-antitoxin system VapC family toxin [Alphaproteobacteria bacterium]|nr:type II toxin-antitoxin system VapC family toxin [Alphaproteobacteria bacterium]
MIILDTNVLSAVMRRDADPIIVAWLDRQPSESLWITTITIFEIRFGLELLPDGRRRVELEKAFAEALEADFQRRILPFDIRAAEEAAMLAARRRNAGQTVEFRDTQIAGIALARQAALATRNVRHFQDVPVKVIDPWLI